MKTGLAGIVALSFVANAAQASSILGDWSGSGTAETIGVGGNGAEQFATLDFLSATPSMGIFDLSGTVDVTCAGLSAAACGTGGNVGITGTLSPTGLLDVSLPGNPNAFLGHFSGDNITGVVTSLNGDVYRWSFTASAAAAPEIDPAGMLSGFTLLAGGLAVIRGRCRGR